MHSSFILDYLRPVKVTPYRRFQFKVMKFFNSLDFSVRLSFKNDELNRLFRIRNQQFENLLVDNCMCIEKAMNIHLLLSHVLRMQVPGDIVELGCYNGTSALLIRETMNGLSSNKGFSVYDSFEGLPEKTDADNTHEYFEVGVLKTNKDILINSFKSKNMELPKIHQGWFKDTLSTQLPDQIAFAHLDGDFYTSIMESLQYVYPKLARNAVVVLDDYCDPDVLNVHNILPGVKAACDEFMSDKPENVSVLLSGGQSQAYFVKQ